MRISIKILIILITLSGCERLFIEDDLPNTYANNFYLLWRTVDRNYSFFELKEIDWESKYFYYSEMVSDTISEEGFFSILSSLLIELKDGHVNLYSDFDRSASYDWTEGYPQNFNSRLLNDYYLSNNSFSYGYLRGTEIDSIGYLYIESFADLIRSRDIDSVLYRFRNMKGIIVDVRNNSGGLSNNGQIVAGRFTDTTRIGSYTLYKTGPGHNDFGSLQPNFIYPAGSWKFERSVVVLTNRRTFSAANDFVLYMSNLPNVTIIGGKTGGGGGTPYDYQLINGWRFRLPRTQTISPDGVNIEPGINPDIEVTLTNSNIINGIDNIIEAAINYIKDAPPRHPQ